MQVLIVGFFATPKIGLATAIAAEFGPGVPGFKRLAALLARQCLDRSRQAQCLGRFIDLCHLTFPPLASLLERQCRQTPRNAETNFAFPHALRVCRCHSG